MLVAARLALAMAAALVVAATGIGWAGYRNISGGITTSQALVGGPASVGGDQNILIMGLDSRLDQHGRPLPQDIYDALHAGDETAGGYNANVLIVLHVPGGGGPVTAISIPRDDYVDLAGCAGQQCQGKIKQAYGFAYQRALDSLDTSSSHSSTTSAGADDPMAREQAAREAGRKAEISTVRHLLGIPIDHFIEVTLVAFFQIAQVVQPITVCLNNDTSDPYSGADFHHGVQQIDAAQAMAFVRQRRDVNDELFTDLDRTRRQQAFIASLASALRHGGALSSPSALRNLLDVARQNIAVDTGFDLATFVQHASTLTDSPLSLYTLPITAFGQNSAGEDVNLIDVSAIRSIVHNLVATGSPTTASSPAQTTAPGPPAVLNVVNASNHTGLATSLEHTFASRGFTEGTATTADSIATATLLEYGAGAHDPAQALGDQLDVTPTASDAIAPNTVQLTIGSDFTAPNYLSDSTTDTTSSASPTTPVTTVAATATGTYAPGPTDLTRMNAIAIPCVK
jgi:LCP family protein required for cell wall assembly